MFGARVRDREARAVQATAWGDWGGDRGQTWAGVAVDSRNAMQLLTVYGCVRLISDQISTLPVDVFNGDGSPAPKPSWIEEPVSGVPRVAWLTQLVTSVLLDGNAYFVNMFSGEGRSLPVLDPKVVKVTRESGQRVVRINGQPAPLPVVHIAGMMLPGAEMGVSPVEYARQTIGGGMAAEEFGSRFFGQGAVMSGVIEVPGELPPNKAGELARAWARAHSGKSKSHLPGVLEGGAKWQATSVTNEQAQFLETRKFTAAEIAGQMFLVDPSDLGIPVEGTSLTYANLEQRNTRRLQVALLPWIVRVETALSSLLPGQYVKLNVDALKRGDTTVQHAAAQSGLTNGYLTVDEVRSWWDLPSLPAGAEERLNVEDLTFALQKIYLAVGTVITVEEAREILNRAGAGLTPGVSLAPKEAPNAGSQ